MYNIHRAILLREPSGHLIGGDVMPDQSGGYTAQVPVKGQLSKVL